jgi:3-hydroxyisobutyrate dehydrogenase
LLLDAVTGTAVDSTYLQMKGRAIIARDFTPSFSTVNAAKDAGLVTQGAVLGGVMLDVAEAAGARLRRAITLGHGDEDMAAAYFASWPGGHRD